MMYDFTLYNDNDLQKIRDACLTLARYDLQNRDLMAEANKEISDRERTPDNPDLYPPHPDNT